MPSQTAISVAPKNQGRCKGHPAGRPQSRQPDVDPHAKGPGHCGKNQPDHRAIPIRFNVTRWIKPMIPTSNAAKAAAMINALQIWIVWP